MHATCFIRAQKFNGSLASRLCVPLVLPIAQVGMIGPHRRPGRRLIGSGCELGNVTPIELALS